MVYVCEKKYDFRKYTDIFGFFYEETNKEKDDEKEDKYNNLADKHGDLKTGEHEIFHYRGSTVVVRMQSEGSKGHLEVKILSENKDKADKILRKLDKAVA
jgi:hypothetical protein